MNTNSNLSQGQPGPVVRLSVERRRGRWRVTGEHRVDQMTVPASQDLPDSDGSGRVTGLWFETVDANGTVLYRQSLAEPPPGREVHESGGHMVRVDATSDDFSTDLRVPLTPGAVGVRLFHVPSDVTPEAPEVVGPPTAVLEQRIGPEKGTGRRTKRER